MSDIVRALLRPKNPKVRAALEKVRQEGQSVTGRRVAG